MKKRFIKHSVGPGPNEYILVSPHGVEGYRFIKKLKEVFPNRLFLDPYNKSKLTNLIYIAPGVSRTARVYVRKYGEGGKLVGVCQPVELVRSGNFKADVLTWVRCLWEVYDDLDLPCPLADVEHHIHCLDAGEKMEPGDVTRALKWVRDLYREHERG